MYQKATAVERPFEYDVPADNGNMRFGVKAHHKYRLAHASDSSVPGEHAATAVKVAYAPLV